MDLSLVPAAFSWSQCWSHWEKQKISGGQKSPGWCREGFPARFWGRDLSIWSNVQIRTIYLC